MSGPHSVGAVLSLLIVEFSLTSVRMWVLLCGKPLFQSLSSLSTITIVVINQGLNLSDVVIDLLLGLKCLNAGEEHVLQNIVSIFTISDSDSLCS